MYVYMCMYIYIYISIFHCYCCFCWFLFEVTVFIITSHAVIILVFLNIYLNCLYYEISIKKIYCL